jgi:hypothetical protein
LKFGSRQRRVGGAERNRLGFDLLDAATGADRLIVETEPRLLLVGIGPFGIDREGEGGPCPGNIECGCGRNSQRGGGDENAQRLHRFAP